MKTESMNISENVKPAREAMPFDFVVIILLSVLAAAIWVYIMLTDTRAEKTKDDIMDLRLGTLRAYITREIPPVVNCDRIAVRDTLIRFDTCMNANPYGGDYIITSTGKDLHITVEGIKSRHCKGVLEILPRLYEDAECRDNKLVVVYGA